MTLRVLQVIGAMDRGGAETMLMNLHRAIDRDVVQFDYLVHEQRECDYDAEIEALGGRIYRVPRYNVANGASYRRVVREHFAAHPEHCIVHGHIGSSASVYLDEANRAGRFTIAHSHSQNFLRGPKGLAFRMMSHSTRSIADYFMACSREAGIDRFGERVVEGDRFAILRNGIDLAAYTCDEHRHCAMREREGFGPAMGQGGVPVIGHVGRLSPEKNHAFLFDVFAAAREELGEARLVCVGRGPLEDELRALAADRGIADRVTFAGVRDDVPDLLAAFDAFVFPSTLEGLPVATLEAQASGLPVLLSTGVPDLAVASPRTERLPLAEGAGVWAHRLVSILRDTATRPRTDCVDAARAAGFDIRDTAHWLQDFYLSHNAAM